MCANKLHSALLLVFVRLNGKILQRNSAELASWGFSMANAFFTAFFLYTRMHRAPIGLLNEARKIPPRFRSRASFTALNISRAKLSDAEVESPTAYCLWILIRGDKLLLQLDASNASLRKDDAQEIAVRLNSIDLILRCKRGSWGFRL